MHGMNWAARMSRTLAIAGALALVACGESPSEPDEQADGPVAMPDPQQDAGAPAMQAGVIPAQFRGEWGMNAADCEGGAAAKGLLEIGEDTLTFYESVGTLGDSATIGADSVQGLFAFEGEGMEWTREMRLETREGGDVLVRRELGEGAMPGAFEYRRCTGRA